MRDVIIKNGEYEISAYLPTDRVVSIDSSGYVYLYDMQFQISEDMIEKVIGE